MRSVEDAAKQAITHVAQDLKVAVIFGRERTGLFNDELLMCHYHAFIPSNEGYTSLNLAQAVQIVAYELFKQYLSISDTQMLPTQNHIREKASAKEIQSFYDELAYKMQVIGFLNPDKPGHVVDKLKRLFQRAQLELYF